MSDWLMAFSIKNIKAQTFIFDLGTKSKLGA